MTNLRNAFNWTKWTKDSWIEKAKASENRLSGLAIPVVDVDYTQDVAPATKMNTLNIFINATPGEKLVAPLRKAGFTVLYLSQLDIRVNDFLTTIPYANLNQEPARSVLDEFTAGQRNIFIVDVADENTHLFYVCEYAVDQDPLAAYTENAKN